MKLDIASNIRFIVIKFNKVRQITSNTVSDTDLKEVTEETDSGNNVRNGNHIRTILSRYLITIISEYGMKTIIVISVMNGCVTQVIGFSSIGLKNTALMLLAKYGVSLTHLKIL